MTSPKPSESATTTVAKAPSSEEIRSQFLLTGNAAAVLESRSAVADETVAHAYRSHLATAFPHGMAVLAVGGFGRRELFPHSDIDILLLVDKEIQTDPQREALSIFLRTLWDNGLRLSHSVHTIADCCQMHQQNIELTISLLDQRFLVGDSALYDSLTERLPKFLRSQQVALMKHLVQLTHSRHAKFHDTIYHLEPNIKETPGGIRDLNLVHWLKQLRGGAETPAGELSVARDFLAALRCQLHYQFGRDSNILSFDAQEDLFGDPAASMRDYYRHARNIHRTALREIEATEAQTEGGLMRQFLDWRTRLSNSEFTVSRERAFFKSPQALAADPLLALRLFAFAARHGIRPSLDAERRIAEHLPALEEHFRSPQAVWPVLRDILALPSASLALRGMHDTGVLAALFPEWREIECLVIRDFYHRYTVDEHTLTTIAHLEELRSTKDPTRQRFANLLNETEHLPLLSVALLFHDLGKGEASGSHAAESVKIATSALERLGMPEADRRTVLFLIGHHLDLSAVMNSRDLDDPATAVEIAQQAQTLELLRYLTLLTYADISAVNPDAMTPWRLEQLWRVYLAGHRELTSELETDRIHVDAGASSERAAFLEGLPVRYLRTHSAAEIDRHIALAQKSKYAGVAVELGRTPTGYAVTVVTHDRPELFASLAGTLSSFGMDILKAEAFANSAGDVLDTFVFADPMRTLELNPEEATRLKKVLERAAVGKEDVRRLLKNRPAPQPARRKRLEPSITFDSNASQSATLVEVVAEDRPGLLYDVAAVFSAESCSIDVVLIDTEAHKALDVFYVTHGGAKLIPEMQERLREKLLAAL